MTSGTPMPTMLSMCSGWTNVSSLSYQRSTHNDTSRRVKIDGARVEEPVRRPKAIADYNRFMGSVDAFDQLAPTYRLLRRSKK